jgi:hypothetical protein
VFEIGQAIGIGNVPVAPPVESTGREKMNGKFQVIGGYAAQDSLGILVNRQMRKQRRNERRLAERRTTKHQFAAKKSCVADARSYRVAREYPISAAATLDWKALIPAGRSSMFGSGWLKKFRDDQLKHRLTAKQAS